MTKLSVRVVCATATLVASATLAIPAYAAPGALDTTFGGGGKVTADFGSNPAIGVAVALQEDGRIVMVGNVEPIDEDDPSGIGLVQLHADGTRDSSFGNQGLVTTGFGHAADIAVQDDGKIVVVGGRAVDGCCDAEMMVMRFSDDGTLDATFSDDGIQTANFGSRFDVTSGVAIQDDGKIVVAGTTDLSETVGGRFVVLRFHSDGRPDTTFDSDGAQMVAFARRADASSIALQSDGRIVVAGSVVASGAMDGETRFGVVRLTMDGTLDTSFSGDGRATTGFGRLSEANDVAISGDGKIVVVGQAMSGGNFAIARYRPDGTLDSSFSGDGRRQTDFFGGTDEARGVQVLGDGKLVVVGWAERYVGRENRLAIARFKRGGGLDSTFSGDGRVATRFGREALGFGLVVQPDGKLVAVGGGTPAGRNQYDFVAARYLVA